mmetsp:Transcript_13975/g.29463  ORF Transcript_13975/g.29463 Transcript_13975/m.29463 type:complete len:248 (-) Transcript_13975:995-1738(-)|eukprot:CAMPEP_0168186304 /NCGR_PEP_ID=MMETSP0139_2-20121125/14351_1 /TAXON_ID=44445 /ORGANISM="Pseudo-nitzschia australis, Strain 10249 10 AB" /LENGTH=247 /DNA_ID=CAMNT_0008108283 /DNA_START=60 /DNA_END=803 /DNA_ORIENTATION=+
MGKRDRGSDVSQRPDKKKKSKNRYKKVEKQEDGQSLDWQRTAVDSTKLKKQQSSSHEFSNSLVDEDKPVFFRKRAKLSISLLPWSLKDCKQSVENSLRKMMLKYSNGLGGILMAYDDVQLRDHEDENSKGKGWILNELPHVHYDVSCNVLVFYPSIGCQLKGIVNECFPSHVGMLVFGYINAMVSAETIREAGYTFDVDLQTWTKGGDSITSGAKINFVVTMIHECDGTISLEGDKPARSLLVDTSL